MGLLDDAIKEHLDLKRRRGADPTEIERLEREALGPVRSIPQEATAAEADYPEDDLAYPGDEHAAEDLDHEPEFEPESDYELEEEEFAAPMSDPEPEFAPTELDHAPTELDHAPTYPSIAADTGADTLGSHGVVPPPEAPQEEEPYEPPSPPPEHPSPPLEPAQHDLGAETAEYDVEAEHAENDEGEGEDDDPLEETPEFLQDAPDHDRLWFEQRPPRDFDFDG